MLRTTMIVNTSLAVLLVLGGAGCEGAPAGGARDPAGPAVGDGEDGPGQVGTGEPAGGSGAEAPAGDEAGGGLAGEREGGTRGGRLPVDAGVPGDPGSPRELYWDAGPRRGEGAGAGDAGVRALPWKGSEHWSEGGDGAPDAGEPDAPDAGGPSGTKDGAGLELPAGAGSGRWDFCATADLAHRGGGAVGALLAGDESDVYEGVGTRPYVMVAHDPLSTFAVDVDTASYDIFRRDVLDGRLPQPESVRLEEYVNVLPYDYPAPAHDAAEPFAIHLEVAPSPLEAGRPVLSVGIRGKEAPPEEVRPANLVFLVDVSGSMGRADKEPLVRRVLTEALEVLQPTDRVAVVTYASQTQVRLESTAVSKRELIQGVIDGLLPGGATAGGAGLLLAYQQAEANFIEGGINHIVLCTAGDFNVGPASIPELVELVEEKRRTGVTLTVLGFGSGNLNDAMMEEISNRGNGVYGVIANEDHAVQYVRERLLSTMTFIAKDVKIQVEFNPEHVLAYRLLGYENRAIADDEFRDDLVDAGEIGSGHTVTALYELVLACGEVPEPEGAPEVEDGEAYAGEAEVAPDDLVLVKVRYKHPDAGEEDAAFEVGVGLEPGDANACIWDAGKDHRWAVAMASFAEILKESPFADPGRLAAIEEVILSSGGEDDTARQEFLGLFARARELLDPQVE